MKEFKYNLKLRHKENACQYTRTYNNLQGNQKKVIKPRIEINQNIKKTQTNVTITELGDRPEKFIVNIWSLEISNVDKLLGSSYISFINKLPYLSKYGKKSLSRIASNCMIRMNILEDYNTKYDTDAPLCWNRNPLSDTFNTGTIKNKNQRRIEYADILPLFYYNKLRKNTPFMDIPKNTKNDILLFFTFEESEFIHLSTWLELSDEYIQKMTLPFNMAFEIQIRFSSNEYVDSEGKSFKLTAYSWEDIDFQKN